MFFSDPSIYWKDFHWGIIERHLKSSKIGPFVVSKISNSI